MDTGIRLYAKYTSSARYACFDCRVCFHKTKYSGGNHKCPTCKKQMLFCGTAFRAPPKRNVREWAKLEVLVRAGMKFHYCGGNGQLKGTTIRDARDYRKRVTDKDSSIGRTQYAIRRPGKGNRVATKAWYGWDSYRLPD